MRHKEQKIAIEELAYCLKEAMCWNWLDFKFPPPRDLEKRCERILLEINLEIR